MELDGETLRLFIEDSQDNMSGIENNLLAIEAGGEEIDDELVNKVFRAVHSVKGSAGFMGLKNIKELAHGMENILNLIRKKQMVPEPNVISVLLKSADVLSGLIKDAGSSNKANISEQLKKLKSAATSGPARKSRQTTAGTIDINLPDGRFIFTVSKSDLEAARKQGNFIYLVEDELIDELGNKDENTQKTIEKIKRTGVVIGSKVDAPAEGEIEKKTVSFFVMFSTVLEPDLICRLLTVNTTKCYLYSDDGQIKSLSPLEELTKPEKEKPRPKEAGFLQEKPEPKKLPVLQEPHLPADQFKKPASRMASPSTVKTKDTAKAEKSPRIDRFFVAESSLRVNVKILDIMMTLAGEMVLIRNQLLQTIAQQDFKSIENASQRLNRITSELQDAIMSTRLKPIGNVFNKFHRIVRDMSRDLGKEIVVIIQGQEIELDKTIIEAIADPLIHLVRNAVDHGLETPEVRQKAGKNPVGTLKLSASHEAGQIIIEITDDGAGIDPLKIKEKALSLGLYDKSQLERMTDKELVRLIFEPGFSTVQKITDVSGRGVGMDVVLTNLSKLNGDIDIESQMGRGTTFQIKLPLTLAIIPSLIISVDNGRCAIPQANLVELVGIPPAEVKNRIEKIGTTQVMRLRENLLPLIRLRDALGISSRTDKAPDSKELYSDQGQYNFDRQGQENSNGAYQDRDRHPERNRRFIAQSFFNIVVVDAGDVHYGLIVDNLLDTEEIVVKPLGRHLINCKAYAGATIKGDGRVALILDIPGISKIMDLAAVQKEVSEKEIRKKLKIRKDIQSLLIVRNATSEQFAIPLGLVTRIEKINKKQIEIAGGRRNIKYRGGNLPLCSIEEVADVSPREDLEHLFVVVFLIGSQEIGLTVSKIIGIVDVDIRIDQKTFLQPGILGSAIIMNKTTLLVDLFGIVERLMPEWVSSKKAVKTKGGEKNTILIVEDSEFFRNHIKGFLEDAGYDVVAARDGLLGLEALEKYREEIKLVLTDTEMPNLDGLELIEKIREDPRFEKLPVIAVTSLAGEAHEKRGYSAGIDDYLIKFDRQQILEKIGHYLTRSDQPEQS